mmetsp:Transcript_7665/g.21486  ORF Transcript_7665/g.21486 Transcript_7665/m.21486 type:complete len:393 (+) Transcript_7665:318-1496(+)
MPACSADRRTATGSRTLLWFNRNQTGTPTESPDSSMTLCGGYLGRSVCKVRISSRADSSSISLWDRCSSWMASARLFMRMNSQIARTPPREIRLANSFNDAVCTSNCANVSNSIQSISLLMPLWLKSTSPRQRRKEPSPCSSWKEVRRTRNQRQYSSMPASVSRGSTPAMEIFSCHSLPRRRKSKPRRAIFSTCRGFMWPSVAPALGPATGVNKLPSSVPFGSSSSPDWMSAQLLLLLLPAGVFNFEAESDSTELVRTRPVGEVLPWPPYSSPNTPLSEPSKASPSSSPCLARLTLALPPLTPPALPPAASAGDVPLSLSILLEPLPPRFSIFRQTDCKMEDKLRHWPPWACTSSSTFTRASTPSRVPKVCKARKARSSMAPPTIFSILRSC